jgi:hypothetical protein
LIASAAVCSSFETRSNDFAVIPDEGELSYIINLRQAISESLDDSLQPYDYLAGRFLLDFEAVVEYSFCGALHSVLTSPTSLSAKIGVKLMRAWQAAWIEPVHKYNQQLVRNLL